MSISVIRVGAIPVAHGRARARRLRAVVVLVGVLGVLIEILTLIGRHSIRVVAIVATGMLTVVTSWSIAGG
jgi:hypothetical protein